MSLQQTLFDIDDLHSFSDLGTFAQHILVDWVESALHLSPGGYYAWEARKPSARQLDN